MCGEGQRVKSDPLIEFGKWVNLMENGTDKNIRMVIFDNAKELVARWMKELCDECGIQIILLVLYSPSPNSVTTKGTQAISHGSGLPPQSWAEAMEAFVYPLNRWQRMRGGLHMSSSTG